MSRFFYIDPETQEKYEYSPADVCAGSVRKGLVRMTDAEVKEHLNPMIPSITRDQVEHARLLSYSDPLTGCDRYQSEAKAERLAGNEKAALLAEEKLLVRREEIKAENPWPKDDK